MVHQEGGLYFQTNFRKGFVQSHLCELVNLGVYICIYIYISKWQTCPQSGLAALLGCPQANRCNNPWILKYIQNMPDRHGDCFGVLNKQGIHRKRPLTRSLKSRRYGFIGHDLFQVAVLVNWSFSILFSLHYIQIILLVSILNLLMCVSFYLAANVFHKVLGISMESCVRSMVQDDKNRRFSMFSFNFPPLRKASKADHAWLLKPLGIPLHSWNPRSAPVWFQLLQVTLGLRVIQCGLCGQTYVVDTFFSR